MELWVAAWCCGDSNCQRFGDVVIVTGGIDSCGGCVIVADVVLDDSDSAGGV